MGPTESVNAVEGVVGVVATMRAELRFVLSSSIILLFSCTKVASPPSCFTERGGGATQVGLDPNEL